MAAELNLRAFLDGGDAARAGEEWLQSHITPTMRAEWPENMARIVRHQCGGDNLMAVLWHGPSPLASYTVLRDDFNRSKLLLWERNAGVAEAQPLRHATKENGDCPHWCRACAAEAATRGVDLPDGAKR